MLPIRICLGAVLVAVTALLSAPIASAIPADIQRTAFIDDSFGEGYGAPAGQGYLDLMENFQAGDQILPIAHGGATVKRYLPGGPYYSDLDQLATWGATTVVVPLGTNDWYMARPTTEYAAHLTALVAEIRLRVPTARVILYHHFGGYVAPNPAVCDIAPCVHQSPPANWTAFGTAMRNVAIANYTGYIDDSTAYPWSKYLYDGLHPNAQGHNLLFQSVNYRLYYCC